MSKLDNLLSREMTRKQFLVSLLTLIGSVLGFSNLIALFTKNETKESGNPGYGRQNYGP